METLELPKVLERLAAHAAFSASKTLAHRLKPTSAFDEAQRRLAETTEARLLFNTKADLSVGGARDVRSVVEAARRGAVLEPSQLLDVKGTMIAARTLRRTFERPGADVPVLGALAGGLEPAPGLIDAITQALNDRGDVLDSASLKLAAIRGDVRATRERLTAKLERMVNNPDLASMLQEPIITQREGRYVIPLRAEFKGRLPSVIHDQSSSGATLFIEPLPVVDLNNELREHELAERDEVRRVLTALSTQVGDHAEAIIRTVEALARLDLAFAKAHYAEAIDANPPVLKRFRPRRGLSHPGSTLRLFSARHPLLDPASVVPIDLSLDADAFALVITGPNTGGKTVTLKTAALLALMAQCGMHIPAASGSELSVFDGLYADIGDEQSIEQSLSTFSSHISNIIRILARAATRSLVVLDELGAGTDPQEGSALARAILSTLLGRRITTLIATHYPELKAYAQDTPGVRNASVEFDLESLRPTYRLTIGLPGRSNALAIASRLGLDEAIVERARGWISQEALKTESLLDEIYRQRQAIDEALLEAERQRDESLTLGTELAERLEAIEDERLTILAAAKEEARQELEAVRRDLQELRRKLAAAAQPLEALEAIEGEVESLEDEVAEPVPSQAPEVERWDHPLRLGDTVRLATIGAQGVITALSAEEAEVQIGRLRVRARLDELTPPRPAEDEPAYRTPTSAAPTGRSRRVMTPAPPLELDLRGLAVDEAVDELERRLDAAYLSGMPFIRVVHGKGTGRLREAIRRALKDNPYVTSYRAGDAGEGGDGVTVVSFEGG